MVHNKKQLRKYVARPGFARAYKVNDEYGFALLNKTEIDLLRPIHLGAFVLQFSKLYLIKHWHRTVGMRLNNPQLCLVDTDSFLVKSYISKAEKERQEATACPDSHLLPLSDIMDFSNVRPENPNFSTERKGVTGYLKNEIPNRIATEVVALRSKLYCVHSVDPSTKKEDDAAAADADSPVPKQQKLGMKGISRATANKTDRMSSFKSALFKNSYKLRLTSHHLRSKNFQRGF